ncbi:MAG: metallophosphoesterase, partial [bacterium]
QAFFRVTERDVIALLIVQPVVFVLANIFIVELLYSNPSFFILVKRIFIFNTLILPFVMLLFGGIALYWCLRHKGKRSLLFGSIGSLSVAVFLLGLHVYATHIEPKHLTLGTIAIETPKVNSTLRVLHITDTQSACVGSYEKNAFERMKAMQPDLVLFTGDLVQPVSPATYETEIPKIATLISSLNPPLGILGVFGDTDDPLYDISSDDLGGMRLIERREEIISFGDTRLNILCLSLAQSRDGDRANIKKWLEEAAPTDFTILMGHAPDYVLSVNDLPIDLCLAGHTHGGQVVVPFIGALVTASSIPAEWARGFRQIGNTQINISAGIGCEHVQEVTPIRFNCPPEMTLIELVPPA